MPFPTWMDLEGVKLSRISQTGSALGTKWTVPFFCPVNSFIIQSRIANAFL